jgi:hypothetical protein
MMIAKLKIWFIAIIGTIVGWLLVDSFIIEISFLQFFFIDCILFLFKFFHKLATRDLRALAYPLSE